MRIRSMVMVCLAACWALAGGCEGRPQAPGMNADSGNRDGGVKVKSRPWDAPSCVPGHPRADGGSPADAGGSPPDGATMGVAMDAGADAGAGATRPSGSATVQLNEIDYDQPGPDDAEFVELRNTGTTTVALDGLTLVTINGADGTEYGRFPLEGDLAAGGFAVVAAAGVDVDPGALRFDAGDGFLQNGPDGVAVVGPSGEVIDAVAYEAPITWSRGEDAGAADLSLVAAGVEDTGEGSLVRAAPGASRDGGPNGGWRWASTPTPGAPNPG